MLKKGICKFKKTTQSNYIGYYRGFYIFIYKRPHGKWCCRVGRKGNWLWSEGYFGTSLSTLKIAKKWAIDKIDLK